MNFDKRIHYILMLDTETANAHTNEKGNLDMRDVLVYDCGFAVIDTKGNVYDTFSFVNKDIFSNLAMMYSSYYARKIPQYIEDLSNGKRIYATTLEIRQKMLDVMRIYGISEVCAHNARFDYNALNNTLRYISSGQLRFWFPFETEIWDTLKMSSDVIAKMPTYKKFCIENGYITKNNQVRKTAEILYRFIAKDNFFKEEHTGLADVLIESEILWYCYRQKKKMQKRLFKDDLPELTDFQKKLLRSLKENPVLR